MSINPFIHRFWNSHVSQTTAETFIFVFAILLFKKLSNPGNKQENLTTAKKILLNSEFPEILRFLNTTSEEINFIKLQHSIIYDRMQNKSSTLKNLIFMLENKSEKLKSTVFRFHVNTLTFFYLPWAMLLYKIHPFRISIF